MTAIVSLFPRQVLDEHPDGPLQPRLNQALWLDSYSHLRVYLGDLLKHTGQLLGFPTQKVPGRAGECPLLSSAQGPDFRSLL